MSRELVEVRFHGRGGQGAWTASLLLAQAGLKENKYIQSFPSFGPERSGAPITAFTRISVYPIHLHSSIYEPDIIVILDPTLLSPVVLNGAYNKTKLVVNTNRKPGELKKELDLEDMDVWTLDATSLAITILGRPITNTAMLGAIVKATGIVKLESLIEVVKERFSGRIQEMNVELVKTAYKEAVSG